MCFLWQQHWRRSELCPVGLWDRRKSLGLALPLLLVIWWRQEEEATGRRAKRSPGCEEERQWQEEEKEEGGAPHAPWREADTTKATAEALNASLSSGDAVQVELVIPTEAAGGERVQARNLQLRPPPCVTEASSTLIRFPTIQATKVS